MFNNRQEYILRSPLGEKLLDLDPMGWKDTETEIGRSEKTYGIFLSISNNLKFTGEAKDFLELNYKVYGVNAEVELTKRIKHLQTDEWQLAFTGFLDFTTRKIEENKFIVDFIEGGLREVFTSQLKEKYELNRIENIKGKHITPLVTDIITLQGRDIYQLSRFTERISSFTAKSGRYSSGDTNTAFHPLPLSVAANSDPLNINPPYEYYGLEDRYSPSIGNMFYATGDRDKGITKVKINVNFEISDVIGTRADGVNVQLVFNRYTSDEDGGNIILQETTILKNVGNPVSGLPFAYSGEEFILEPKKNESYALGLLMTGRYGDELPPPAQDGYLNVTYSNFKANMTWAEDSFFKRTNAPFLTAYEVGERLTEIYTGKKKFISSLLTSGSWENLGFTCGAWLRNLKLKTETGDEKEWPLTISFEDFYKSINAVLPVGYGIVTKGAKEFIALENIRYFFQPYVTIKLGEVSNIKRETASEFLFSSITTGYTKGGNYEKPLGLDEYNIQATNISPLNKIENKYEALGTSRADSYAVEDARRMQREDFADEDTPYDKDNFLIDAKFRIRSNIKNYYEVRLWQDDFEQAPTGVYSPETAFNLRLSPANNKLRHSTWFNGGLYKFPSEKLRYSSTEGNSQLATKLPGKPIVKEDADTLINDISNPIFEPEWVNFDCKKEQEIIEQLQGSTEINGKDINNFYGLVEFINEDSQTERGYLFTAKIKNTIEFKVLKSYGV